MRVAMYLMRRARLLYGIWWAVMACVLVSFLVSFQVFGHWIVAADQVSAWSLAINVAPGWFLFVMGIIAAVTHLPIGIANGITRREFSIGAGIFAVASAALFALGKVAGLYVEALAYNVNGIMDELAKPYPWPTLGGTLTDMLSYLGFMVSGWLIALIFYRLRVWWALLLAPFAAIPLSGGMEYTSFEVHWALLAAIVAVAAVVAYLVARGVAVKPKKA